jgi:class 3 adenylate cyclase
MSIRVKIAALVAAFMLLFCTFLFIILYYNIQKEVKENVEHNFTQQQKTITQYQKLNYDRLVESALLVSQSPAFKANVSLNDAASVNEIMEEFLDLLKVDLIYVTDGDGNLLSSYPESAQNEAINEENGIARALRGEIPEIEFDRPVIWQIEESLYQVITVPVNTAFQIIGSLSLGILMSDYEAKSLQLSPETDIHFLNNMRIHASSATDTSLRNEIEALAQNQIKTDTTQLIESDEYFMSYSPLDENKSIYLVSTTSKSSALKLLHTILRSMGWLALGAFLMILIGGGVMSHIISAPLFPFIKAFNAVAKGDLTVKMEEDRQDEFGSLSKAFNHMIHGLKERIQLQKYVGGHTLESVALESQGSQKITGAVMFSDIRGFTSFSQDKDPTVVVNMLNEWLGFQTEIIMQFGGNVDKFVGDEVFALFRGPDALDQCISCAQEIQNHWKLLENKKDLGLGIGINFGSMIMGDIGNDKRKDYTVIGAVVNMAARLCNHAQKGQVLIPYEFIAAKTELNCEMIQLNLKGISQTQNIAVIEV